MYVYIKSGPSLWTVGFYVPTGKGWQTEFVPESDWSTAEQAAERVHFLNGGVCRRMAGEVGA